MRCLYNLRIIKKLIYSRFIQTLLLLRIRSFNVNVIKVVQSGKFGVSGYFVILNKICVLKMVFRIFKLFVRNIQNYTNFISFSRKICIIFCMTVHRLEWLMMISSDFTFFLKYVGTYVPSKMYYNLILIRKISVLFICIGIKIITHK